MKRPANPQAGVRTRLADGVVESLSRRAGALKPGGKLPSENQLAAEFGVSRTVIREAISQLKGIGVLQTRQGAGIFVAPPSHTTLRFAEFDRLNPLDIAKFFEIRLGLDAAAARLAAARRTKLDLGVLRETCRRTIEPSSPEEAAASDIAFHLAVVGATANEHLVSVYRFLNAQLREGIAFTRRLIADSPAVVAAVRQEHMAILRAVEARDADRAADCSREHIVNSLARLKTSLGRLAKSIA